LTFFIKFVNDIISTKIAILSRVRFIIKDILIVKYLLTIQKQYYTIFFKLLIVKLVLTFSRKLKFLLHKTIKKIEIFENFKVLYHAQKLSKYYEFYNRPIFYSFKYCVKVLSLFIVIIKSIILEVMTK